MADAAYPIKHWLSVLFLGPFLSALSSYFFGEYDGTYLEGFFIFFLMGLMYATPSLVIYYCIFWFWIKKIDQPVRQKILLNLVAIGMAAVTFILLPGINDFFPYAKMGYPAAIILCGFLIKIRRQEKKNDHLEYPGS